MQLYKRLRYSPLCKGYNVDILSPWKLLFFTSYVVKHCIVCALYSIGSCYNLSAHSFLHTSDLKDTLTEYLYSNVRKVYFRKTTPHNPTPQWTGTHTRSTHTYRDFKGNRNYSLHTNWGLAYSPWLSPWLSFI